MAASIEKHAGRAGTFCGRFLQAFSDTCAGRDPEEVRSIGVPRRKAAAVLQGVPYRFIPSIVYERRRFVLLGDLLMLCACLDDEEVGASPGNVSAAQVRVAWCAAGHERYLIAQVRNELAAQFWKRSLSIEDIEYALKTGCRA